MNASTRPTTLASTWGLVHGGLVHGPGGRQPVSSGGLAEVLKSSSSVISTDLFDTVLLRDGTSQIERLRWGCRRAAPEVGVAPAALTRLRWDLQVAAYRAMAIGCSLGEASLSGICATMALSLGLPPTAAEVLRRCEVDVDIEHLRANRTLLEVLRSAAAAGKRVIAVTDTYYSGADVARIVTEVTGVDHPLAAVYVSADIGRTKHAGQLFDEVARREGVAPADILHIGDNFRVDVVMAQAASWRAHHVPRGSGHRLAKAVGALRALPIARLAAR